MLTNENWLEKRRLETVTRLKLNLELRDSGDEVG